MRTLRGDGLNHIDVLRGQALLFLLISGGVGVLAALWRAVQAARTAPLAAINEIQSRARALGSG